MWAGSGTDFPAKQSHNLHGLEHIWQYISVIPTPRRLPQGLLQGLGHLQELWCGKFLLWVQLTEQDLVYFTLNSPDIQEREDCFEPGQHWVLQPQVPAHEVEDKNTYMVGRKRVMFFRSGDMLEARFSSEEYTNSCHREVGGLGKQNCGESAENTPHMKTEKSMGNTWTTRKPEANFCSSVLLTNSHSPCLSFPNNCFEKERIHTPRKKCTNSTGMLASWRTLWNIYQPVRGPRLPWPVTMKVPNNSVHSSTWHKSKHLGGCQYGLRTLASKSQALGLECSLLPCVTPAKTPYLVSLSENRMLQRWHSTA